MPVHTDDLPHAPGECDGCDRYRAARLLAKWKREAGR